jgi:hypothetical protein
MQGWPVGVPIGEVLLLHAWSSSTDPVAAMATARDCPLTPASLSVAAVGVAGATGISQQLRSEAVHLTAVRQVNRIALEWPGRQG